MNEMERLEEQIFIAQQYLESDENKSPYKITKEKRKIKDSIWMLKEYYPESALLSDEERLQELEELTK